MPIGVLQRNYNMTDPELCMFVSNLVGFMTRDATEYATRSIVAGDISALQALGNAYEIFPDDGILQANVSIAVEDKEAAREALFLSAKEVYNRALSKWGDKAARYKSFGSIGMISLNDLTFLFMARRVHQQGTFYKTELLSEGLTQGMLDDLEDKAEAFELALNAIKDAEAERDMKTEERIENGNELYSFVSKYCEIGKQIWENVSEARYNDYVIYPAGSGSGTVPAAPELQYSPDGFYWDEVPTATSYELVYRASSDTEWLELYSGSYPESSVEFAPGEGDWVARLRARNSAGFGDWSEERTVFIGLRAPQNVAVIFTGAPDNFLRVSWSSVTGADYIEVWCSIVAFGQPAGTFAKVGQLPSSPFQQVAILGNRHYFYLIAKNAEFTSEASSTVFFDVPV